MSKINTLDREIIDSQSTTPFTIITGPSGSGKGTLCRKLFPDYQHFSLGPDHSSELQKAQDAPASFLTDVPDGAIIEGIERAPALLPHLVHLATNATSFVPRKWVFTSSQTPESLGVDDWPAEASVFHHKLLSWSEVNALHKQQDTEPPQTIEEAMFLGGYPALHAPAGPDREEHYSALIENGHGLIDRSNLAIFRRFLGHMAAYTGEVLDPSAPASDAGIGLETGKEWIKRLEQRYLVFMLPPHFITRRKTFAQIPKMHLNDSGLACWLLGISSPDELDRHPLRDAIFDTWVVSELVKQYPPETNGSALSFYNELTSSENPTVIKSEAGLLMLGAKCNPTPGASYFRRARRVQRYFGKCGVHADIAVAYEGDAFVLERAGALLPWTQIPSLEDCLASRQN